MPLNEVLHQVIALTEKSIELAQAELWDQLVDNEASRQATVADLQPILDELESLPDDSREKLEQLIGLNDTLANLCSSRREELASSIKQMSTGRHANKAYTD